MSIAEKHIMFMGSSTMAQENAATDIGGPINESIKVVFEDLTENATLQIVSDTATDAEDIEVIITGRDATGALITENIVLDGTTAKASASPLTFERLILASVSGDPFGTIALISSIKLHVGSVQAGGYGQADNASDFLILNNTASAVDDEYQFKVLRTVSGDGAKMVREIVKYVGATRKASFRNVLYIATSGPTGLTTGYEISDGMVFDKVGGSGDGGQYFHTARVTKVTRPFYNAAAEASGGSEVIFVEKVYALNLHTSLALTNATISEQSGGVATDITFALASNLNEDSTNYGGVRTTSGALGLTMTWSDGTENIANSQNLSTGAGQAVWLRLQLAAGAAATNSFYKMQVSGQST